MKERDDKTSHFFHNVFFFSSCRDKDQVNFLRQQLVESAKVSENLKKELSVYEKLYKLSVEGRNSEGQAEGKFYFVLGILTRTLSNDDGNVNYNDTKQKVQ